MHGVPSPCNWMGNPAEPRPGWLCRQRAVVLLYGIVDEQLGRFRGRFQGHQHEVIHNKEVDAREAGEQTFPFALDVAEGDLLDEAHGAVVMDAVAEACCALAEGTGEVALAGAGWARDQHHGMLAQPGLMSKSLPQDSAEYKRSY